MAATKKEGTKRDRHNTKKQKDSRYRKIEKRERNRKIGRYRKIKRREKEKRTKEKDIQIQKKQ
jgi:hypothetical protein